MGDSGFVNAYNKKSAENITGEASRSIALGVRDGFIVCGFILNDA
jgi:hypothetical protein